MDLISIAEASTKHGIAESTLRAVIRRNNFADPIGDDTQVYDDCRLARLARKCAAGKKRRDESFPNGERP